MRVQARSAAATTSVATSTAAIASRHRSSARCGRGRIDVHRREQDDRWPMSIAPRPGRRGELQQALHEFGPAAQHRRADASRRAAKGADKSGMIRSGTKRGGFCATDARRPAAIRRITVGRRKRARGDDERIGKSKRRLHHARCASRRGRRSRRRAPKGGYRPRPGMMKISARRMAERGRQQRRFAGKGDFAALRCVLKPLFGRLLGLVFGIEVGAHGSPRRPARLYATPAGMPAGMTRARPSPQLSRRSTYQATENCRPRSGRFCVGRVQLNYRLERRRD